MFLLRAIFPWSPPLKRKNMLIISFEGSGRVRVRNRVSKLVTLK